ncbi:hypothetical protein SROCM77S_00402 [Streptomyces rochei]
MARLHATFSAGSLLAALLASGMTAATGSVAAHFGVAVALLAVLGVCARTTRRRAGGGPGDVRTEAGAAPPVPPLPGDAVDVRRDGLRHGRRGRHERLVRPLPGGRRRGVRGTRAPGHRRGLRDDGRRPPVRRRLARPLGRRTGRPGRQRGGRHWPRRRPDRRRRRPGPGRLRLHGPGHRRRDSLRLRGRRPAGLGRADPRRRDGHHRSAGRPAAHRLHRRRHRPGVGDGRRLRRGGRRRPVQHPHPLDPGTGRPGRDLARRPAPPPRRPRSPPRPRPPPEQQPARLGRRRGAAAQRPGDQHARHEAEHMGRVRHGAGLGDGPAG